MKERGHEEDIVVDGKIILQWILTAIMWDAPGSR
jgi:hypothetical protein